MAWEPPATRRRWAASLPKQYQIQRFAAMLTSCSTCHR